jgi:hypothetical protein
MKRNYRVFYGDGSEDLVAATTIRQARRVAQRLCPESIQRIVIEAPATCPTACGSSVGAEDKGGVPPPEVPVADKSSPITQPQQALSSEGKTAPATPEPGQQVDK